MAKVIECDIDYSTLVGYATDALKKNDYLLAIQNLNEAQDYATTKEKKADLLQRYLLMYRSIQNLEASKNIISKYAFLTGDDDFYKIDSAEFIDEDVFFGRDDYAVETDEEETDNIEQMFILNAIKTDLYRRKYPSAFEKIMVTNLSTLQLRLVTDYILEALISDPKLKLSDYMVSFITILARCQDNVSLLNAFLQDGPISRKVLIDSLDVILDNTEDPAVIVDIGESLFLADAYDEALRFFQVVLEIIPDNETALYYSMIIEKQKGEYDKANKKLFRLNALYSATAFPFGIYNEYLSDKDSDKPVAYPFLPDKFINKVSKRLIKAIQTREFGDRFDKEFLEFLCVANAADANELLIALHECADRDFCNSLLLGALKERRVSRRIKERLISSLIIYGYEGNVNIAYGDVSEKFVLSNIHHKVKKETEFVYQLCLRNMPFMNGFLPIKCNVLANIVKKIDSAIDVNNDNSGFAMALTLYNYFQKMKLNGDVNDVLSQLNFDVVTLKTVAKEEFKLDSIIL